MTAGTLVAEHPATGAVILRLNRPERLNALVVGMFEELIAACATLRADESARAGAGRGFCAGYDLDEAQELAMLSPAAMLARQDLARDCIVGLRRLRQPVIAAVNGAAMGGRLSLALAADSRIASPRATFSEAFVRFGLSARHLSTTEAGAGRARPGS
jgi:enoyl-CoA hydratase/carnithine racemase